MERLRKIYPDPVILFTVFLLSLTGILTVFSVKVVPFLFLDEDISFRRPLLFVIFTFFGISLMSFISYVFDYRVLKNKKVVYGIIGLSLLMLIVVLIKKYATEKDVDRWLIGTSIQPMEFSKLAIVIFVAHYIARKGYINKWGYFIWITCIVIFHSFLLYFQPDKGMAILILVSAWTLLWIGGVSPKFHIPVGIAFALVIGFFLIFSTDYVRERLKAWFNPMDEIYNKGYQIIQSLISFMNGGLFGVGYGKGFQKLGMLTQADTDYVLSVIGEEFGLAGVIFVFFLYYVLISRLIKIAREVYDTFGKLLIMGVCINLAFGIMVNVLMAVNLLPPKGIPLPFISYGVSNLIMNFVSLGIVGSVYRYELRFRI